MSGIIIITNTGVFVVISNKFEAERRIFDFRMIVIFTFPIFIINPINLLG